MLWRREWPIPLRAVRCRQPNNSSGSHSGSGSDKRQQQSQQQQQHLLILMLATPSQARQREASAAVVGLPFLALPFGTPTKKSYQVCNNADTGRIFNRLPMEVSQRNVFAETTKIGPDAVVVV